MHAVGIFSRILCKNHSECNPEIMLGRPRPFTPVWDYCKHAIMHIFVCSGVSWASAWRFTGPWNPDPASGLMDRGLLPMFSQCGDLGGGMWKGDVSLGGADTKSPIGIRGTNSPCPRLSHFGPLPDAGYRLGWPVFPFMHKLGLVCPFINHTETKGVFFQ